MKLSARNQLNGSVERIEHGAVNSTVKIRLAGGDLVTSSITKEAAEDLALETGSSVIVVIKASDVMVAVS